MAKLFSRIFPLLALLFLASCESDQTIVSNVDEREANEIVVYLSSKGIDAQKVALAVSDTATTATPQYNIMVGEDQAIDAMATLNRAGLPRRMGTNLLELFAKSGLMSSDREETIRYQAGLAEELRNTIRKIDGVLEADVQISFPTGETAPGATPPKTTAAVYVKHQGILEDPNSHLEVKIKRLMSSSVNGLDYNDVAVISDRSRFADITLTPEAEKIGGKGVQQTYVSIWGLVMTKASLGRFRFIFFSFIILVLATCAALGWTLLKYYPQIRMSRSKKGDEGSQTPPSA